MLHTKTKGIIGTIILIFMAGWLVGLGSPAAVAAGTDYNELAAQAVQNNYQLFQSGAAVDGGWGNFGAYDAYILTQAGVDTETWVGENGSFKSAAIDLIDASLNNEATAAKSSSKRMAQDYLAAKSLGESDKASQLLKILQDRQGASGNGSFDANAFSDIPAFEMLGRAGDIGRIDAAAAIAYLLGEQDSSGAWTSSWQDFMATAEAIRALEYLKPYAEEQQLEVVNTAINKGCDWLKLRQISNGGFQDGSGFDDPVVDTSEATFTLLCLGIDPGSWTTTDGKSPLDYLKDEAPNADGTFGSYANIASNTWILDAYWQLGARLGLIIDPASSVLTVGGTRQLAATFCDPDGTFADVTGLASWSVDDADIAAVSQGLVTGVKVGKTGIHALYNGSSAAAVIQVNSSGDSTNPGQDSIIKVYIQVVGQNNDILYGPGGITLDKNNQYGLTPIGALNATGLSWQFSERFPGLVVNIGGTVNEGMSGWMFKVNGVAPSIPASDYNLLEGDQLIWWYSSDAGSSGPDWDDTLTAPLAVPVLGSKDQEIKKALDLYNGAFDQLTSTTLVINGDKAMSYEQRAALKKDLDGNSVKILAEAGEEEAVLTDDKQEIILLLPKESLNGKINLSVEENASSADVQQYAVKIVSPVYDFGPDGTVFDGPVTIALKVPLNEGVNLNNLTPAYYDDEIRQWVPIPGIVDVEKCLVVFKTTHFTSYALIETPLRKSFSDLDESLSWARDAIEILAGQGVVQGTGKGFEPQRLINRAEFVQLLAKAWQWDDEINPAGVFKDVDSSDWFASAAAAAFQKDIIKGYPDGSFGPLNNITRNEMAIILQKLAGEDNEENNSLTFKDQKDIPDWALKGVKYACRKELIKGYEDETFKGGNPLKRAEAAVIIFRCLNQNQS